MTDSTKYGGKRLRLSADEVDIINEHRGDSVDNINGNTALDIHLKDRGINKDDVVSVKHWQSMSGELRFSIVTKENLGYDENQIFKKINDYIENYAPTYEVKSKKLGDHLLVVNPADIHIGKYANEMETGEHYDCEKVSLLTEYYFVSETTYFISTTFTDRLLKEHTKIQMVNGGSIMKLL